MKRSFMILLAVLLTPVALAGSRSEAAAQGLGVNLPIVGRLVGGGNTLFVTSVDISNNSGVATQVDFYFDAQDLTTGDTIIIDGSITNGGLAAAGTGSLRGYSNAHFDDFVDALVDAGRLSAETRDHGVLGSLLLVYNGFSLRGEGSASARFENDFGGGTVGVAVAGHPITTNEPQQLVATVRDTRGRSGPQLYTNMFINNIGLTPGSGAPAGSVTVELTARANSSGASVGVPIVLENIGAGQTRSVGQVLTAMQVPASEDTILVYVRVTSGNAAIAGVVSTIDVTTRDGSVVDMSRADFN